MKHKEAQSTEAQDTLPPSVESGLSSIARHIAAPAKDCGIPEQYDEVVRRAHIALTLSVAHAPQQSVATTPPSLTEQARQLVKEWLESMPRSPAGTMIADANIGSANIQSLERLVASFAAEATTAALRHELDLLLKRAGEIGLDEGFSSHYQHGFEMFRSKMQSVIKARIAVIGNVQGQGLESTHGKSRTSTPETPGRKTTSTS